MLYDNISHKMTAYSQTMCSVITLHFHIITLGIANVCVPYTILTQKCRSRIAQNSQFLSSVIMFIICGCQILKT